MFTNDKILAAARFILRDEIQSLRNEAYVIWEMIYIKGMTDLSLFNKMNKTNFSNKLQTGYCQLPVSLPPNHFRRTCGRNIGASGIS